MFAVSLSLVCCFELNSFKKKDNGVSVFEIDGSEDTYFVFVGKKSDYVPTFF